ncbi:MAG TPA: hypothetical protein H9829_05415 [Candidatus Tetragenococcus pullicola]|nr:hypothetical protein [Candidatus Tetragenococcus pullicola]
MNLPELFTNGKTPEAWRKRRPELLKLFADNVYGQTPLLILDSIVCKCLCQQILPNNLIHEAYQITFKKEAHVSNLRYEIFSRPNSMPLPVLLMIDVFDSVSDDPKELREKIANKKLLDYSSIIDQGYALIVVHANDLSDDHLTTYSKGILEFSPRVEPNDWGAIGAWAWGVSQVVNQIEKDQRFDKRKIALLGISRAGKTALWCGAQDERISIVIAGVSGCGGASLFRESKGESIQEMTTNFPYWTCKNFTQYAGKEENLPIDQHLLLALIAPRPLYLFEATNDNWCDAHNSFQAAVLASEVYQLFGKKGLGDKSFPKPNTPLLDGNIGYHIHEGEHGIFSYDWQQILTFLSKYFKD